MEPSETRKEGTPPTGFRARVRPRRVLVVGGAKGGVGKSVFATNLGLYLATIGRRVVLVDADPGGANLHTFLGMVRPESPLPSATPDPTGGSVETAVPGLRLLSPGLDLPPRGGPRRYARSSLLRDLRGIDCDYCVVDIGSGTGSAHLDAYLGADTAVFLTLPEPTAIERTHQFLRGAFARFARTRVADPELRRRLLGVQRSMGGAPSPLDLVRALEAAKDPLAAPVAEAMHAFTPRLVLNQARARADLELGDALRSAIVRRLGLHVDYLGHIDFDDTVWSCVRNRRPLLVESPGTKASRSIEKLARRILAVDSGKGRPRPLRTVPFESHHDLLEVDRGATDEEVRRAYKRAKEVYAPDSLACYGLFDAAGLDQLRVRLDEAYDVLLDPARRRPYELSVFPAEPEPAASAPRAHDGLEPRPAPPDITPDTEFNGLILRMVRESRGLDLKDIAQRTKIGLPYLRAIEDDEFTSLPALVYVRGFVAEFAKLLQLDAAHVSRTYTRRYRRYLEDRGKA